MYLIQRFTSTGLHWNSGCQGLLFSLTARAQAEKGHVRCIDLKTGLLVETLNQVLQQRMLNFTGLPADTADQVVVIVPGNLVDQLPAAHMCGQHHSLFCQKG